MVLLAPPPDCGEAMRDVDWVTLVDEQGFLSPHEDGAAEDNTMSVGDVYAMYDRNCFAEEWSHKSRRIFVCRWDEVRVLIYDEHGTPIDDPANFTPDGVQTFSSDFGDNAFLEEWKADEGGSYYLDPRKADPQSGNIPPEVAELAAAPSYAAAHTHCNDQAEEPVSPAHVVEGWVDDKGGKKRVESPSKSPNLTDKGPPTPTPSEAHKDEEGGEGLRPMELEQKLQPGTRLLVTHPQDKGARVYRKSTLYMRKKGAEGSDAESILLVFDESDLRPQYMKLDLDEQMRAKLTPEMFIYDADDIPLAERCVGVVVTKSALAAEGFFYGQFYCGQDGALLAPDAFRAVVPATAHARFPSNINPGDFVTLPSRDEQYVLVNFLIAMEATQARCYALLGNPAALLGNPTALLPSPTTLLHRFAIVSLFNGKPKEANFQLASPARQCERQELTRLREEGGAFVKGASAGQLKRGEFGLPKVYFACPSLPGLCPPPANLIATLLRAGDGTSATAKCEGCGATISPRPPSITTEDLG